MKPLIYCVLLGGLLGGRSAVAQVDTAANQVPEQWLLKNAPVAVPATAPVVYDQCFPPEPELLSGGGNKGITTAIQQRLVYPPEAGNTCLTGRVFVKFTITPTGEVMQVKVIKSLLASFDSAAVAAVRRLPPFKPWSPRYGNVQYVVSVYFQTYEAPPPARKGQRRNSTP